MERHSYSCIPGSFPIRYGRAALDTAEPPLRLTSTWWCVCSLVAFNMTQARHYRKQFESLRNLSYELAKLNRKGNGAEPPTTLAVKSLSSESDL
jgi:hypothetical protein